MKLKPGVKFELKEGILKALPIIERVWLEFGHEAVITAGVDGKHMEGSFHYKGLAVDVRTRYFTTEEAIKVKGKLQSELGDEFDVVLHHGSHMHIEYDPY